MRHYITFGGTAYDEITAKVESWCWDGRYSFDYLHVYDEPWLMAHPFYKHKPNRWLWEHPGDRNGIKRGFGWFAWKPLIILDALSRVEDGDIVMYVDADTYPIRDFSMLYNECDRIGGVMLFGCQGFERFNYMWCKRDCTVVMDCDSPKFWFGPHACARFMLFQKGAWIGEQILSEWLTYCLNTHCQTFDDNVLGFPNIVAQHAPRDQQFREHRTEQAILSNLAIKHGIRLYRELCQFGATGEADRDLIPEQLFEQQGVIGTKSVVGSRFANVPWRTR